MVVWVWLGRDGMVCVGLREGITIVRSGMDESI